MLCVCECHIYISCNFPFMILNNLLVVNMHWKCCEVWCERVNKLIYFLRIIDSLLYYISDFVDVSQTLLFTVAATMMHLLEMSATVRFPAMIHMLMLWVTPCYLRAHVQGRWNTTILKGTRFWQLISNVTDSKHVFSAKWICSGERFVRQGILMVYFSLGDLWLGNFPCQ